MAPDMRNPAAKYDSKYLIEVPSPLYFAVRVWRVQSLAAPAQLAKSHPLPLTDDLRSFDFSVKVERPLSLLEVMNIHREVYQGTPFDLTQGIMAGPAVDTSSGSNR